jgi:hypothetical protein
MLLFFTFGLPLTVSGLLFAKRKSLYNPKVHAMMGFLYARFQTGSEFWEIHEVVRKCALMGLLIFLPPTSRAAVAILICVVCCCTLNYFQPHRNRLVLFVSQLSFLMSTFKYICAIFLRINAETVLGANDATTLGWVMATMDVVFILVSLKVLVLIVVLLRASAGKAQQSDTPTSRVESGERGQSRLRSKKSHRTKKVDAIQKRHEQHRNSFVASVLKDQTTASARVEQRLSQRKANKLNPPVKKKVNQAVVVPVAPTVHRADNIVHIAKLHQRIRRIKRLQQKRMGTKEGKQEVVNNAAVPVVVHQQVKDTGYEQERKYFAKRILHTSINKKDILIQCFQRLAPMDRSDVLSLKSLAIVLRKLKVSKPSCIKMAEEIAAKKGSDGVITLAQFVEWAKEEGM